MLKTKKAGGAGGLLMMGLALVTPKCPACLPWIGGLFALMGFPFSPPIALVTLGGTIMAISFFAKRKCPLPKDTALPPVA